jgi:hypothetical protein
MSTSLPVIVVGVLLIALSSVQAWLLFRLARMVAAAARLEDKVGHLADALSILTETSEAGFKAIADEMTRRGAAAPAAPAPRSKTPIARIRAAARKGASIAEIAAAEHMSEGEVRLRLHLADHASAPRRRSPEGKADALRA